MSHSFSCASKRALGLESDPQAHEARYPRSMPHAAHEKGGLPTWLSDDERAFRASLEGLVDFYRVAQGGALFRAFWPGAFVALPLGSFLMALAMRGRTLVNGFEPLLTLAGIAVIASAPLWAIYSLLSSMRRDDRYVAIFQEELRVCLDAGSDPVQIPWSQLDAVELREQHRLVLTLAWGELEISQSFAELDLPELGRRLRDAKRLALWGRLTRPALLNNG
jgi:hypothetical protein